MSNLFSLSLPVYLYIPIPISLLSPLHFIYMHAWMGIFFVGNAAASASSSTKLKEKNEKFHYSMAKKENDDPLEQRLVESRNSLKNVKKDVHVMFSKMDKAKLAWK